MLAATSAQSVSSDKRLAKWATASADEAADVCATGLGRMANLFVLISVDHAFIAWLLVSDTDAI
jgi:hypothetical protein